MNAIAKVLAAVALTGTILPPLLYLLKAMSEGPMKLAMLVATIVWFATAPFCMKGGGE